MMAEIELGGSISLVGFGSLEPVELVVVKKIVGNFVKKLNEKSDYESLVMELRQHKKGKTFLHEINAHARADEKMFSAKVSDYNLYSCISKASEKILSELVHNKRSSKVIGEGIKKKTLNDEKGDI